MKIAVTGSTGFIGSYLCRYFPGAIPVTRKDFEKGSLREKISMADVVINLAGRPIIKRWSRSYRKELVASRIETTKQVVQAVNAAGSSHLISASAIGIYPDNTPCDESCPGRGADFLAELASRWEKEAEKCRKKVTVARFGMVLGKTGGALAKMLPPFRLGIGGPIGSGDMMVSWIAIHDLARLLEFVIDTGMTGPVNAVSPHPVSNKEFTRALAQILGRPAFLPVPKFVLKLLFGQAAEVLTASKEIYPKKAIEAGFRFQFPEIRPALEYILREKSGVSG